MKGNIIFFALILITSFNAAGQSNTTISGQVTDKNTKAVIPYASVVILSEDNSLVNGGITDDDGFFIIQGLEPGNYRLEVSFLGYNNFQTDILIGTLNQNYDVGKITLEQSVTQLEEVTVKGERSEIADELDKKTYSMSNSIAQSGGSVMDAMKAMPSVSFDQNGRVILRGSDKVVVLIDGKQSSLTGYGNQKGLDNIPASNIERIEIINNPSAKYDATGMAGIINIVYLKEQQTGLHGNAGLAYGLGALTKPKEDLPTDLGSFSPTPKYIPSLDLNYKTDKLSFFMQSEVLFQKRLPNNEFTTRYYNDGRTIASQVPENRKQTHYIVKGGIDYQFDESNNLSFSGIYDWESHIDSAQVPYIYLHTNTRNRYINWREKEITGYMNYMLHYSHAFKQIGHEFHAHLQYSKGWEDETYHINDSSAIRQNGRDVTSVLGTEHTTTFTIDYTKPLTSGRIETGAKIQIRRLPVEYEQERGENSILYPGLGSWTKWGESIYAGYINWVHEKTKYSVEAGLRTEYTAVFYDMDEANIYYTQNDSYDYFKLFPNIRLSYKFNENNKVSLFYNQRIDRPGEPELRMYAKSDDHELVKVGNPYLRPQYTKSAEIGYKTNWQQGSLFLSGYYRFITDEYMRVYTQDTSRAEYDVVLKSYANTGKSTNLGFELVFNQKVSDFYELSGNLNIYQNKIKAYTGTLLFPYEHTFNVDQTTDNTWDFKIINTITLPKELQLQLTALYFAPKNIPQGKQLSRSSIDLGMKKKLWQGKGEFSFAFTDIFNQFGIEQEIDGDGFSAEYQNYYETQIIRVGLKYKF
ncbi:outer membrane beta-barrel family protein [Draconibacterium sp. IB214405]|uniref:outer membrane beta-barrel family protein n=1 Tax=Draconibacterium sp. IB214405 TaxID=3097352 RepID=UPI002A17E29C|nr:outer membrane beta-barrel family protein [Draconibacterium sp. IB214405]MDX8340566.1 outer membrane beta-barrel family protein [Draconibacterium sp. IB214405]